MEILQLQIKTKSGQNSSMSDKPDIEEDSGAPEGLNVVSLIRALKPQERKSYLASLDKEKDKIKNL